MLIESWLRPDAVKMELVGNTVFIVVYGAYNCSVSEEVPTALI